MPNLVILAILLSEIINVNVNVNRKKYMNKLGKNIFTNWKNILRFKDVSVDDSLLLEADEKKIA